MVVHPALQAPLCCASPQVGKRDKVLGNTCGFAAMRVALGPNPVSGTIRRSAP